MKYTEYKFSIQPAHDDAADVLAAMLGECGFETFVVEADALKGYIQTIYINKVSIDEAVQAVEVMMGVTIAVESHDAPNENFNATWEAEGFRPIVIGDRLAVHATTHTNVPTCRYDIKINPCMAFGTGTHATTQMLLTWLLDHDMMGRSVIDAGCGTGILGILAMMRGAKRLLAYDIDEWSVRNAQANLELNGMEGAVRFGDSTVIEGECCDVLIANINRNILLADMGRFAAALADGGTLLMSGFYKEDIGALVDKAALCELEITDKGTDAEATWCWLQFCRHV